MSTYDIIVIGAGPGGYVAAIRAAQEGANVALIEKEDIGGVCLNWGCIPSKILLKKAETLTSMRAMLEKNIVNGAWEVDYSTLVAHSREKVEGIQKSLTNLIGNNGVEIIRGAATLSGENTILVTDADGAEKTLTYKKGVILATGARARELPHIKPDGKSVITSREALELDSLPKTLAVIGGGVIGCEFASLFAQLGTNVTIIELADQLLPGTDRDIARALARSFKNTGINVLTGKEVARLVIAPEGTKIEIENDSNDMLEVEKTLLSVGITANTESLGLDAVGVETQKGFILVDPTTYETNVKGIYAIGDVIQLRDSLAPHLALAHVATAEAELVIEVILQGEPAYSIDYENIPLTIFTNPEIASVGLTEYSAKTRYPDDKIIVQKLADNAMGIGMALEQKYGFIKLVVNKTILGGQIVGAHIIGPSVTERIHMFVEAISAEDSARHMARQPLAHPTFSEIAHEGLLGLYGEAPHIPMRGQAGRKSRES